jgi:endonuclease-8
MPEGPSIITLKKKLDYFIGKTIIEADGYAEIDYTSLKNKKVLDVKSWGKHFFICLSNTNIEMHLRLFGSCMINRSNPRINAKLHLKFKKDELNFYVIDVKLTDNLEAFNPKSDILSDDWDSKLTLNKLKEVPNLQIGDALLTQDIFSGVGNIIKNEALWLAKIHPETKTKDLTIAEKRRLIKFTRQFSLDWLKNYGKKGFAKEHGVYQKEFCKRCGSTIEFAKTGKSKRGSYWCTKEQILKP